jgi:hypothetical protein
LSTGVKASAVLRSPKPGIQTGQFPKNVNFPVDPKPLILLAFLMAYVTKDTADGNSRTQIDANVLRTGDCCIRSAAGRSASLLVVFSGGA